MSVSPAAALELRYKVRVFICKRNVNVSALITFRGT